jgi:plasmid stability protein
MKTQASYTIRGVPPEVDRALRKKAAQQKRSLNQIVVDELTRATVGRTKKSDFSNLVGKWTADPGFDETIAAQRQIDLDKWK